MLKIKQTTAISFNRREVLGKESREFVVILGGAKEPVNYV